MDRKSFALIARRLGCPENATSQEQITYLRAADAGAIVGCTRTYMDSGIEPKLFFRPQEDGVFIFSIEEQLRRARQGKFAKVVSKNAIAIQDDNTLITSQADAGLHELRRGQRARAMSGLSYR